MGRRRAGRDDALRMETEAVVLERIADAGDPFDLAVAQRQFLIVGTVAVNPIAAFFLGHEAGSIGHPHQIVERIELVDVGDQADRQAGRIRLASPEESGFEDDLAQRFRHPHGVLRTAAAQDHAEFIAANPRQQIAFAQALLQQSAQLANQLVASGMSTAVVDNLQLIEVEVHDGMTGPRRRRQRQHRAELALEFAPVRQAGQRVMTGLMRHLQRMFSLGTDVVQNHHHTKRFASLVAHARRRGIDGDHAAIRPDQIQVGILVQRRAIRQHRTDDVDTLSLRCVVQYRARLGQRVATQLIERLTEQVLGHRIAVIDAAVEIGPNDGVGNRRQSNLREFTLDERTGFDFPEVRNIENRARHPDCPPARIPHRFRPGAHPEMLAGLGTDAVFDIVRYPINDMGSARRNRRCAVVRMHHFEEDVVT